MTIHAKACFFLNLCILWIPVCAVADNLVQLPPRWQQLDSISRVDISPLQSTEQAAINEQRATISALLQSGETGTGQLAAEFGQLGKLYMAHELFTSADACFLNAMQLQPDYFPWAYYAAYLAYADGNMDLALVRLKKAASLDPSYSPLRYRLGLTYLDLNRPEEAEAIFRSMLDDGVLTAGAHNGLGQVFLMQRQYEKAVTHFSSALELQPKASRLHYSMALALRALGRTEEARKHIGLYGKRELKIKDKLVDSLELLKDPANRRFVEAMTAIRKKEYDQAIAEFKAGLVIAPDNTAARTSLARVLYFSGHREESREQLEIVIGKDPEKTLALFLLGQYHDESGNKQRAVSYYKRVLQVDPGHSGAHFYLGTYYLHQKDYISARKHLDMVTRNEDSNISAHTYKLVAMMGNEAPDADLLALSRHITSRAPDFMPIQRIQVLLLALSSDPETRNTEIAIGLARKMYKAHPFPANLELVALATASTGDFPDALDMLTTAITNEKKYSKSNNLSRMNRNLQLLSNRQLPSLDWSDDLEQMLPPPTRAFASFRNYPDANPI